MFVKNPARAPSIKDSGPSLFALPRSSFKYLEAKTGTSTIATSKLHSREMTIVNVKLLNICARTPSSLEYITRGKKTQIVVSVLAVMAVIIS